jgi:hypothetical protein
MVTFEQVLDEVAELSLEQQELLIKIVSQRNSENRRKQLAKESQEAFAEFKQGNLSPQTVEDAIADLRNYLNFTEEVE